MTIEEAISWYETKLGVNEMMGFKGPQNEAARLSIAALSEQLTGKNKEIEGLNDAVERRDRMLADQSKALSDLQGRFDIINSFEQSQCAKLLVKIAERDKALTRVTAERDAAIMEIERYTGCQTCKTEDCYKRKGCENCHWQWRGQQKEKSTWRG